MTQTITLHDGTIIDTLTGRPVRNTKPIEIPSNAHAVAEVTRVRKRVHDLPEPPEKMNAIALVGMYYMYGLNDHDIAYVTGLTEHQVANIKMLEAFSTLMEQLNTTVLEGQAEDVRSTIAAHAHAAVDTITSMMKSEDDKVAIVAAKDVLDRAGHRPADIVEHKHTVEGGLTIEYIKKDPAADAIPVIDVTPKETEDGDSS